MGKALLQPDSILTQIHSEIAPVLQVTVSFQHLVPLNKQSELQSIPGDGTKDIRHDRQSQCRKPSWKIHFEKELESISYTIRCEFLMKPSDSSETETQTSS